MKKKKFWNVLLCIGIYLLFVLLLFPFQNLRGKLFDTVYKNSRITLQSDDMGIALLGWPGVTLYNADVSVPMQGGPLNILSEKLTARIGIGGLFPFVPVVSVFFQQLSGGGNFYAKIKKAKTSFSAVLELDGVNLNQFEFASFSDLKGKLDGDGDLFIDKADPTKSSGYLDFTASGFTLPPQNYPGILALPELKFGSLLAKVTINNGVANFNNVKLGDAKSDIQGELTGELKLAKKFDQTRVNVRFKVKLSDKIKKSSDAATLVSLLKNHQSKTDPNTYDIKWNFTIAQVKANPLMLFLKY